MRLKSPLYIPLLVFYGLRTILQVECASGKLNTRYRWVDGEFWTLSLWEDEASMKTYRNQGVHRQVMPKLVKWGSEAGFVNWHQENTKLPDWQSVEQRMQEKGRRQKFGHFVR
ncbi:MAG: DUF3291 domain-containing protein [Pelatocladus maniniholoensis HA4357-MV3]|uniref:DUF3291 domain-containing protein n=1 Tax=Pelatocladus maniniholoensis HA4357-MV3 TaxID=1117104 RepID=A0A9E3HDV1_9NOST|nr:DUF3291 domain-containing protein [Pelatocladus maniniholoensis HA4357-MV3]